MTDFIFGETGLIVINLVQTLSPLLDLFFLIFTSMGNTFFYVFIVSVIYWLVSKKAGVNIASILIINGYLNILIKNLVGWPRPYIEHPDKVIPITQASGYSFPSGHAQSTAAFWSSLLHYFKDSTYKKLLLVVSILFFILIPFSRVYLAVHYPGDVIVGFIFGIICFWLYTRYAPFLVEKLKDKSLITLIGLAFIVSLLMIGTEIAVITITGHNVSLRDAGIMGAVFFGAIVGFLLESKYVDFQMPERKLFYFTRLVIGFLLIGLGYLIPKLILNSEQLEITIVRHLAEFFLIGFVISFLAPWSFIKIEQRFNTE